MFKGVDHSVSTNFPSTSLPHRMVIHTMRVDLTDPDIQFLTTPRATDYQLDANETGGLTVTDFQKANHVQVAINANRFYPEDYYLPAGTPMDIRGLAISQGVVVSEQENADDAAVLGFDASNQPSLIFTNWPAQPVDTFYTAVSGTYPLVVAGKDIARPYLSLPDTIHQANPRTAYGLSADRHYLYLMTIDGRQPGYSDGAYDYEAAELLLLMGAADGINLDGGGSTTLVVETSTGFPQRLNRSSAVADSGKERTLGSHLGIFAKPLPGFINDVTVQSDDTTAKVTWTTTDPSSSQVQYGTTLGLTQSTTVAPALVSQHTVQLTGLSPKTGYYFQVVSATAVQRYTSSMGYFLTTNYVTTNQLFNITQPWLFTAQDVSSAKWTAPGYDDSTWSGPGPGLLWVDVRSTGPNPAVNPKNTQMPANPSTGYPYLSYYFRTHVTVSEVATNSTLDISGFIDDGAIFYVNGTEVYSLRMPAGAITSQTLSSGYPCSGDATCLDEFTVPATALVAGDNVLAVEVHNYNARSADITFGIALNLVEPLIRDARLEASFSAHALTLSWKETGYVLESATALSGPWSPVQGVSSSPYVVAPTDSSRYYRLRR
jgi:hypothetical protein